MDDYEYEVVGAKVIETNLKPKPYNPLRRPPVSYKKPVIALLIYLLVTAAGVAAFCLLLPEWTLWFWLGWSVVYFFVIGKRMVIWLVHLYQNKASDKTRLRCLFEPSCSEYMILAVGKYGLIRGVCKGCGRLCRCRGPNGGVDYP